MATLSLLPQAVVGMILLSSLSLCWAFQATPSTHSLSAAPPRCLTRISPPVNNSKSKIYSPSAPGRSSLQRMSNDEDSESKSGKSSTSVKFFELDDAFEDDGDNVVGAKFFGGSTVKEELYVPEEEEMALQLQNVDPKDETEYKRFEDENAFDTLGKRVGESLQAAINEILYNDEPGRGDIASWKEGPSLTWETPFAKSKTSGGVSPLNELEASKLFYNKLDVAILSAKTVKSDVVEVRWDIGA
eukprot:scaffold14612_cov152-Alexandrium_tamarense.AAC.1